MKDLNLEQLIAKHGIENLRFLVPMRPLRKAFFMTYTSTNDSEEMVMCRINEERHKLSENYKVTLQAEMYAQFGKEHFYITDFNSLMRQGTIRVFIEL